MAPLDKLPETTTTPDAAPTAPTEGGVSVETVAKGQKLETSQKLGALGQEIEQAQAEAGVDTDMDEDTDTDGTSTPAGTEKPKTGWAAFFSSLSAGWSDISKWFGDAGKKFEDWIKDLMGGEGVDPDEDKDTDADADRGTDTDTDIKDSIERRELSELAWPNAPIFSFLKDRSDTHVSSRQGQRADPVIKRKTGEIVMKYHDGIDIPAPVDTPIVLTATTGTVVQCEGSDMGIKIGDEIHSFRHLNKLGPKVGTVLHQGDVLGWTGNVGYSTGPHLHYRVRKDEKPVDAEPYLPAQLSAAADDSDDEHEHGVA